MEPIIKLLAGYSRQIKWFGFSLKGPAYSIHSRRSCVAVSQWQTIRFNTYLSPQHMRHRAPGKPLPLQFTWQHGFLHMGSPPCLQIYHLATNLSQIKPHTFQQHFFMMVCVISSNGFLAFIRVWKSHITGCTFCLPQPTDPRNYPSCLDTQHLASGN